ncbi:MAG: serine/threonine-protein kinase [Phycisphaerae bacterium]
MNDARFEQLDHLFKAALELPVADRSAFLQRACGDDRELLDEVRSLLGFHERETVVLAEGVLNVPLPAAALEAEAPEQTLPRPFGRYQLMRVIGQGGMGIVYEAVQDQPRRTVALKVIRPDLAGRGILRRFQLEADVLAQLQHPGIAHIYDAGVADGKQPYFAMELVRGEPLCDYARTHKLVTRARLELFALICDAVQHAHERGVVHRDLKPGNILVGEGTEARRHEGTKAEANPAGYSLRASVPSCLRAFPKSSTSASRGSSGRRRRTLRCEPTSGSSSARFRT